MALELTIRKKTILVTGINFIFFIVISYAGIAAILSNEFGGAGGTLMGMIFLLLLATGLTCAFLAYWLQNRLIVSRVVLLNNEMGKVVENGSFSEKVTIDNGDELSSIAYSINLMLERGKTLQDEHKRSGEILQENERLVTAGKAKTEFLSTMSHEMRTHLNSIIGFSELLRQKIPGDLNSKQEHFIANILNSSKHLLEFINNILGMNSIEKQDTELDIEKISIPMLVNGTLALFREKAQNQNITLKAEFDPELHFIIADKQKMRQIIYNLLSNAIKFSKPEGGTVTITSKKIGSIAKISIQDTGIGIREDNIGRLFKEYEQIEKETSGKYMGIGLAASKKLAELHGGKIMVESKYNEGSTFSIYLPVEASKGIPEAKI